MESSDIQSNNVACINDVLEKAHAVTDTKGIFALLENLIVDKSDVLLTKMAIDGLLCLFFDIYKRIDGLDTALENYFIANNKQTLQADKAVAGIVYRNIERTQGR